MTKNGKDTTTGAQAESTEISDEKSNEMEILGNSEPVLNRSIVSESNKIGIKFDQTEDYGPLDKRAGNFTKLQCILRSRKKSVSKPPARTGSARRGKK